MLTVSSGSFGFLWQGDGDSPWDANDSCANSNSKYNGRTGIVEWETSLGSSPMASQIWQINLKKNNYTTGYCVCSDSWTTHLNRTLKWQAKVRILKRDILKRIFWEYWTELTAWKQHYLGELGYAGGDKAPKMTSKIMATTENEGYKAMQSQTAGRGTPLNSLPLAVSLLCTGDISQP